MDERHNIDLPLEVRVEPDAVVVVVGPRNTHCAMSVKAAEDTLFRLAEAIFEAKAQSPDELR
ncbi:MAG: hypothetical protein EON56_01820 [Alphaproteobacteria bacterium]|nr:MAG: hypothetical protein EON56_01820 [Alphaproteobacteria bacterium]